MATEEKHVRPLRIALVVLAVLSALVVLATFGISLPFSAFSPLEINGPTCADSNGEVTAIVDSESRRVLLLNAQHKLTGIISCDELNAPLEAVTDVCVTDKTVYVAGVQYQKDSDIIVRERVVAYARSGKTMSVVFDLDATNHMTPQIMSLDGSDDGVYVVLCQEESANAENEGIEVIHVNLEGTRVIDKRQMEVASVYDVGYNAKNGVLRTLSQRGAIDDDFDESGIDDEPFLADHVFTSLDVADDESVCLYDDATSSVCLLANDGTLIQVAEGAGYSNLHVNGNVLTACNHRGNEVSIGELDGRDFSTLTEVVPVIRLSVFVVVVLACKVYLGLFVVGILLRRLYFAVRQGNTKGIGPFFASVMVVLAVGMAIGYISYGTYVAMMETRAKEIDVFADYLGYTSDRLSESMRACDDRSAFRTSGEELTEALTGLNDISTYVGDLAFSATTNGMGVYTVVYGADSDGVFMVYDSSSEHIIGSSLVYAANASEVEKIFRTNESDDRIRTGRTLRDTTQYRLVRIPDAEDWGKTVGVIEVGSRMRTFEASIAADMAQRVIALLVMVLVVYLTYVEVRACAHCFMEYQQLQHHHDSIAILTRPFSFCVTSLASIDAVMTTLIARSLIPTSGMGESSVLLALPSVMLGVGLALGQAIYTYLGSRVVIRKIMMRGAIAMTFAAIFAACIVWWGNFWAYCFAKLVMAIPFGLLYTLSYSLPRRADTKEVRVLAAGGIKRTDTSAAALGTVLGGYAAQELGNAWVYVLVAVVSVIVFVMAANLLPRTKHPLEKKIESVDTYREAIFRLVGSKTTLPVIFFVMLPAILAAGYNSFLFPLFSADLGLDTSSINNLFVLGQLVVFVCISGIEWEEKRHDKWHVATASIGLLGMVFLLFSFNTTLVWAVVTIALVGVLCKASDAWKAMWPRSARTMQLTTGMATGVMFAVRSVLLIVQPLLLGSLLALSEQTAVVVLGVMCSVCCAAFYFTTRDSKLAPKEAGTGTPITVLESVTEEVFEEE